jgi:hypothetical protein
LCLGLFASALCAQQPPPSAAPQSSAEPKVRVNYLNVCSPSESDAHDIAASLQRIPVQPGFITDDFEVARGRSVMSDSALPVQFAENTTAEKAPVASWVRIRREFPAKGVFSNVQYSYSMDEKGSSETLVFRLRDPKDVMQISLQDSVGPVDPKAVLAVDTPVDRIRVERMGKASATLARCPAADQAKYTALFSTAGKLMSSYRKALQVQQIVPADLSRLQSSSGRKRPAGKAGRVETKSSSENRKH